MISAVLILFFVAGYIFLSAHISKLRQKYKVSLGDGGKKQLQYAIRAQGNYFEYSVVFLLTLLIAELYGVAESMLIVSTVLFVLGRVFHAHAFLSQEKSGSRVKGMLFTLIGIVMLALALLISFFSLIIQI